MLFYSNLHSQILPADTVFHQKRFAVVASVEGVLYTGSLAWLYSNWYNKFTKSSFHTFNDNTEWLQMDKAGHSFTSYTFGRAAYDLMRYIGVKENKALIFGGGLGLIYLSTVEIFDGVSSSWGFSFGDMAANTFGTALFVSQQMVWKEQRLLIKYSFHSTSFPQYRPNTLGSTTLENILKDYNGQTYWLSANISNFLPESFTFPKWLNLAVGYGVDGLLGGYANPQNSQTPIFDRSRQYYLALDVDLTKIKTDNQFLKFLFNTFSFLKIPLPAVQFGTKGTAFYPIYF